MVSLDGGKGDVGEQRERQKWREKQNQRYDVKTASYYVWETIRIIWLSHGLKRVENIRAEDLFPPQPGWYCTPC